MSTPYPAHKIPDETLRLVFLELGKACDSVASLRVFPREETKFQKIEDSHTRILWSVCEMIANAGPAGGAAMARAAGAAESAGFIVSFHGSGISVWRNTAECG